MNSPLVPKFTNLSEELRDVISNKNFLSTRTRMKVLSDLDEIHVQEIFKKEQSLRNQAIQEILTSEEFYLKQLEIIIKFFLQPIVDMQLLSPDSCTILFENIETLYKINGELLKELKSNSENIAKAFFKLAPFLKLYSVYAYNYKRALFLLQDIQSNNKGVSMFIANQETRPEVGNKLTALLITPIQRIPRYKLLLQEVLRHTSPKQSDYANLQASLLEIEKVAEHVNLLVAEYEDTQKLLDLQKHIAGSVNFIKPGRKLIREGYLMRVSRKGNTSLRRYFILLSDTLLYCKGDPDSTLHISCSLPLNKCKVEKIISNGLFKITCVQESLLLYSEDGDSEAWINVLQEAVKKYIECRQTLRKDSSSRIPMRNVYDFGSKRKNLRNYRKKRPLSTIDSSLEGLSNSSSGTYLNNDNKMINSFKNSPKVELPINAKFKSILQGCIKKKWKENHVKNDLFYNSGVLSETIQEYHSIANTSPKEPFTQKESNNACFTPVNSIGVLFSNFYKLVQGIFKNR